MWSWGFKMYLFSHIFILRMHPVWYQHGATSRKRSIEKLKRKMQVKGRQRKTPYSKTLKMTLFNLPPPWCFLWSETLTVSYPDPGQQPSSRRLWLKQLRAGEVKYYKFNKLWVIYKTAQNGFLNLFVTCT